MGVKIKKAYARLSIPGYNFMDVLYIYVHTLYFSLRYNLYYVKSKYNKSISFEMSEVERGVLPNLHDIHG